MLLWVYIAFCYIRIVYAQTKGGVTPNYTPSFPIQFLGKSVNSAITLDANWRWVHKVSGYDNCFNSDWDRSVCSDPIQCTRNCAIEGVESKQYLETYGISTQGNSLTLRYVTQGPYGKNIGSRVYVLDASKEKYFGFNLLSKEISITVDISKLPCGLNGAVYLAEMPLDGGKNSLNTAGASYGTGYGDAQCPTDIKYIQGFTNVNGTGACSNEIDLWEANAHSTAFTLHPCKVKGVYPCSNPQECGQENFRYEGVCDKDGGDYNPYRWGVKNLYGKGAQFQVDSSQPFEMITQFITDNGKEEGKLIRVVRLYRQNGKTIQGGELSDSIIRNFKKSEKETNHYEKLGGMATIEASLRRGTVLVFSVWDDNSPAQMRWLDSTYPLGSTKSSDMRGPCPSGDNRNVDHLRNTFKDATVTYGNVQVKSISTSSPKPSRAPTSSPSSTPSNQAYWKCKQCSFIEK